VLNIILTHIAFIDFYQLTFELLFVLYDNYFTFHRLNCSSHVINVFDIFVLSLVKLHIWLLNCLYLKYNFIINI